MKIISIVNYFGAATNSNGALRIPLAAHISAVQLGPKVASSLKLGNSTNASVDTWQKICNPTCFPNKFAM